MYPRFAPERERWTTHSRIEKEFVCARTKDRPHKGVAPRVRTEHPSDLAQVIRLGIRIAELERENKRLKSRAIDIGLELVSRLVSIAESLFLGSVSVEENYDPEFPEEKYLVVVVTTSLDAGSVVKAEEEWTRQMLSIVPTWQGIRLSIRSS